MHVPTKTKKGTNKRCMSIHKQIRKITGNLYTYKFNDFE